MRQLIALLCLGMMFNTHAQSSETNNFKTVDNIALNQKVFTVKVSYSANDFNLQLCGTPCKKTGEFSLGISADMLSRAVINFIKQEVDTSIVDSLITEPERAHLIQLKSKIKEHITASENAKKTEEQRTTDAVADITDYNSGTLELHKTAQFQISDTLDQGHPFEAVTHADDTLEIKEALIQFFNNKASIIFIQAELVEGTNREPINFLNNSFSIPMRAFNYNGYTLKAEAKNGEIIEVDVNHVFNYVNDKFFNYSIANSQMVLSHDPEKLAKKPIKQRNFFDFFTAVIYSDVLAFNTENSNSLLNAQATLLVPMNQKNTKQWTATRQFITSAQIALSNSFENESRYISFANDESINHFDLLKKNNLSGLIALDLITYESKGWFLNTSLGYKAAFYRTGFRYTQTVTDGDDVITNGQLLSLAHGPYLNFEIRPQTNFGADVTLSLEDLNYNDSVVVNDRNIGDDVLIEDGHNNVIFQHNLINVSASFYWLTNPEKSNGGVYARLGTIFHTPSNSIFPQIMVGYATNLTSFVNRFKPTPKEED